MDRTYSIPDEVLELILLRLASPLHLIRAASTSKRLRRIVRDTGFLRRFASVNRPHLVAGSYYDSSLIPAVNRLPSPSALIDGSRFSSLDFLWSDNICSSDPLLWTIRDSRGSLLLLSFNDYEENYSTWHLRAVVCEPFTRRYTIVAPLVRSGCWDVVTGPFFLDADDTGGCGISLSSFRLVCVLRDRYYHPCHHRAVTFTSSASGGGHGSWRESNIELPTTSMFFMGHTKAYLYWRVDNSTVAVMDRRTAEITLSRLPGTEQDYWNGHTVVAGRDDEARIVIKEAGGVLKFFAKSQYDSEWALEKTVQLSNVLPGCNPSFFSHELAWIMVRVTDTALIVIELFGERWPYRLDIETMEAEQVSEDALYGVAFPCELPWPPAFHDTPH